VQYLKEQGITRIKMIYGQSMGGDIAIELVHQLLAEGITVDKAFLDGAPCIKLPKAFKAVARAIFLKEIRLLRQNKADEMMNMRFMKQLTNGDTESFRPMIKPVMEIVPYLTDESVINQTECCYTFDFPAFNESDQKKLYFLYAKEEKTYRTCFKKVKKTYPNANYKVVTGYGHLTYSVRETKKYTQMIKKICRWTGKRKMSFSEEMKLFEKDFPYQNITVGRANFSYVLAGQVENPAIVLLCGGMNYSRMWHEYVRKLSQSYRVLTFDYPKELDTVYEARDAIAELMEKLGIERAIFVGASFGGFMAQLIAEKYPEKVRGLGLFATSALTENTIKNGRKKYRSYKFILWLLKRKHFNYEKWKPFLISTSMKYAKQESKEDQKYLREMLDFMFKDYTKEKDIHITSLMLSLLDIAPCHKEDFAYLNGNVALVFPQKDFFSETEQKELFATFPNARITYVKNGHFGTILECDKYCEVIRGL
jgi:pimeloyl-ACP methyl ester carboxylesterase